MKRFFLNMNPTVRGFLIILAITGVIVALSLYQTLTALYLIARIAFFIAIAVFIFMVWRERRNGFLHDEDLVPARASLQAGRVVHAR